jgi:hypothetical protein
VVVVEPGRDEHVLGCSTSSFHLESEGLRRSGTVRTASQLRHFCTNPVHMASSLSIPSDVDHGFGAIFVNQLYG